MKKQLCLLFLFLFILQNLFSLNEANSLLDSGINEYDKGQYVFAINNLKKYIQISSDDTEKPKAYYYIIVSYYFLNDYSTSLLYINELSARYRMSSYTATSYFWKGLIYQNQKQWNEAEDSFIKFIEMMPKSILIDKAYLALANSELVLQKYASSEKNLKIIIDNYSDSEKYEEASVLYSYVLMQQDKNKEAKEFLLPWINKLGNNGGQFPYKDRFWLYLAEIELKNNNLEESKALLKKIDNFAKKSPSSDIALLRLSQIEKMLGNDKESREYLVRLANEYPASDFNIDSLLGLAIINYNEEDYSNAITLFNEVTKTATGKLKDLDKYSKKERDRFKSLLSTGYFYTAESYFNQNEKKKAFEFYEKVINENNVLKGESVLRIIELQLDEKYVVNLNKIISKYDNLLLNDKKLKDKYLLYKANIEFYNQNYTKVVQILDSIENKNENIYSISILKSNALVKLNKINEAIDALSNNEINIPLNQKAYFSYELSNLYFVKEDFDSALKFSLDSSSFTKYLSDNESKIINIKNNYIQALCYMQTKSNDKSIALFKSIISNDTKGFEKSLLNIYNKSFYYLGWLLYKESNFANAIDFFSQAQKLSIGDSLIKESYFMEAWSYYSKKDYKTALTKFDSVYQKYYPDNLSVQSLFLKGKCYQNLKDEKNAIDIFSKIIDDKQITTYKDQALYELIKFNINKNGLDSSQEFIDRFKKFYPDSVLYKDVLILQAESLLQLQKYSEAFSVYNYCIDRFKDSKDIDVLLYWGGYSSYKSDDYLDTIDLLGRLINNYPDSTFYINALYLLADTYKNQNEYQEEKDIVDKILSVENDSAKKKQYQERLKILNLIIQGYDDKEALLIIKADSQNPEDKFNLAYYYYSGKDRQKGLDLLNTIYSGDKNLFASKAGMIIADEKMTNQEYQNAIDIYLNIISFKTNVEVKAEALYKTAYCYLKTNNIDAVKKVLSKLYETYPNSAWTQKGKDLESGIKE